MDRRLLSQSDPRGRRRLKGRQRAAHQLTMGLSLYHEVIPAAGAGAGAGARAVRLEARAAAGARAGGTGADG